MSSLSTRAAAPRHCPHCGGEIEVAGKPRSVPAHRRFFKLMTVLYEHFPESYWFRPKNAEHLRYFLEVSAGHFEVVKTIRCETVNPDQLAAVLTAVMRTSSDDKQFVEVEGSAIVVKRARTIQFHTLSRREFSQLSDDVAIVIKAELGIDPEQLLMEAQKAA